MTSTIAQVLCFSLLTLSTVCSDDFPAPHDTEKEQGSPLSASDAAASMTVPDGFRVDVFAAEPDVRNPIAMAWDQRGRMWVAENFTYAERTQRFDLSLRDRVLVLEDSDQDGIADSHVVFTDNVQMLTSVEVGRGGVWLMCPPQLLFVPDADQDCVPDGPAQVVLDGFDVGQDNYHNFANGLRWGPDGWLYGRCGHSCPGRIGIPGTPDAQRIPIWGGLWRFHPDRKRVDVLCHGTVNPWGHDWDRNGELFFINTVIGHVWHAVPGAHFRESHGETRNPLVYERMDMIGDHYHFETRQSRSQPQRLTTDELGGGHAHIGMAICLNEHWPQQYHDRLFTLNMHGRRANVDRLERHGAGYVARHEPDFFRSGDPFFRGLEVSFGPDGNMFVLDWSDTGECHEHSGVHRSSGRIYKITHEQSPPMSADVRPACAGLDGALPDLWRRYRNQTVGQDELRGLLTHEDEHVRVWAVRLLTDFWPLDTVHGPLPGISHPADQESLAELTRLAREDTSGLMALTLASTLQRMPVDDRCALARELVSQQRFAADRDLPYLVWYGLMPVVERDPRALADVSAHCRWQLTQQWITRALAERVDQHPEALDMLLTSASSLPSDLRGSVLDGLMVAWRGFDAVPRPEHWADFARSARGLSRESDLRRLNVLFGDGVALSEIRAIALDRRATLDARQSALQTYIDSNPQDLREVCLSLLPTRTLNLTAARGLARIADPEAGRQLAASYRRFHSRDRPELLELMVSHPALATALLDHIAAGDGTIRRQDVTASHARQILNLGDPISARKLAAVWGRLRDTPAERMQQITDFRKLMDSANVTQSHLQQGRLLFNKTCAQCHVLYGEGKLVGPDLTGSQRGNADYLLQNILDPGAVVGPQYRMSIVALLSGRVLNGLVVERNPGSLTLQTATSSETIPLPDIESIRETTESAMPEGLLKQLTQDEVISLLAYLKHPTQVALPAE